jgi:hypothetical protein
MFHRSRNQDILMPQTIEVPIELAHFQLPTALQTRLQQLLDDQDAGS